MVEKLQFVLYYYKTYPTFDVGTQFAMARSRAHENLHKLSLMLYDTLVHLELMSCRELATPEELKAALQGAERLPDATERAYHRSQDDAKQREHYSGKKTAYAEEYGHVAPDKFIVFLGRTFSGHNHDYLMLKQELPPALDWFTDINVRVDLGYLGIRADYKGDRIDIPTKKPRKSKKNPNRN